jgi:hypothetical protein
VQPLQEKGSRGKQMLEEGSSIDFRQSYGGTKKAGGKESWENFYAATAVEDEMILTVLDMQKEDNKFSCFDMNDAFNMVPINKDIVYLENIFNKSDKTSDDKESDNEETDDKKGCNEESDDKDQDSDDDKPLVTVS